MLYIEIMSQFQLPLRPSILRYHSKRLSFEIVYLYQASSFYYQTYTSQLYFQFKYSKITTPMHNHTATVNQTAIAVPNSLFIQKQTQPQNDTPLRIDLKVRLASKEDSLPSNFKTQKSNLRTHEEVDNELQSSERTAINQFSLTNKEPLLVAQSKNSNIKSYLRIKPSKNVSFMPFDIYNNQTIICDRSVYKFDFIFQPDTLQNKVYEIVGKEVTAKFMEGYNGTIFAYGSTGSGKTYTMFGQDDGLVPSVVHQIFQGLNSSHKLSCSMLEIYKQSLIDLLAENELQLKIKDINNNCLIQNLNILEIRSKEETLDVIKRGNHLKKIRETNLNQSSSRSHIVFTFYLDQTDSEGRMIRAKFNLVDLAGSEKVFKSKVEGEGLEEAKKINLSLSCLGNTISALVKNSDHIPYRESKLTRILRQSLMGNSITRLIVTCSINEEALEETISSIKFAQRAQKVQTQAQIAYNINRFKGQKEQKHKMVRKALEHAQTKLNKIVQKLQNEPTQCGVCKEVIEIIRQRQTVQPEDMFSFNPINTFLSPKSKIDLRNYATNPVSRFSSVPKREQSKKSSIKRTLGYQYQEGHQTKSVENKKIFDLKIENQKLKQQKMSLQNRLKVLEEKILKGEKQVKNQRISGKRVIKLGLNAERPTPKLSKQNQPNLANAIQTKDEKQSEAVKTDKTELSLSLPKSEGYTVIQKQADKVNELRHVISVLKQTIVKFEMACQEYRSTICPFQVQVLRAQISLLQQKNNCCKLSPFLQVHSQLRKSLCDLYDQFSTLLPKLFQSSLYQHKQDLQMIFRQRQKSISEIKFNIKQYLEESSDLYELNSMLDRSRSLIKEKGNNNSQAQVNGNRRSLESSYNEFLHMEKYSPFSIV